MKVSIKLLDGAKHPTRAHDTDAGWDLYTNERAMILPGRVVSVRTGVCMTVENGFYYRIVGRSSTTLNGLMACEGIIDAGYTGELLIRLMTISDAPVKLERHTRIAQAIFGLVLQPTFEVVDEMPVTPRGASGFGSSGFK
jgi:dUTP pyrophosphatase